MKQFVLPFLITILGFLQIGGYYLNSPFVYHLGMTYVASPFPRVLAGVRGEDTFRRRFYIELLNNVGEPYAVLDQKKLSHSLQGPATRRIAFRILFNFFDSSDKDGPADSIRYAFCDPGPVLSESGINIDPFGVRIVSWEEGRKAETEISSEVWCG